MAEQQENRIFRGKNNNGNDCKEKKLGSSEVSSGGSSSATVSGRELSSISSSGGWGGEPQKMLTVLEHQFILEHSTTPDMSFVVLQLPMWMQPEPEYFPSTLVEFQGQTSGFLKTTLRPPLIPLSC